MPSFAGPRLPLAEQEEAIFNAFRALGKDMFVAMKEEKKSIVMVVSLLVALMKDQVAI